MDSVTELLSALVATPSVNPMGRDLRGPEFYEGQMTEFLVEFFEELGVPVKRQEVAPGRENVLAYYKSPRSRRLLLFDAHQDTVPVEGMTVPPFEATIEGDRLYGRGACDVKGGLAAMLVAFCRLVRERPRNSASVVMACTVDEEYTHLGASRLAARPVSAELAIVAEPTRLEIVNCHKGAVRWKVRTRGEACHSSTPQLGDNAIYRMVHVVEALAQHARRLQHDPPDPVLGPPSLSVGRIQGGQSVNIVPDWCEIEVDRRVIPGEDLETVTRMAEHFVRKHLHGQDQRVEFLPPWVNMPPLTPQPSEPWVPMVQEVVSAVLGQPARVSGVPYGTDAGPLSTSGLPCLVFGPGDIAQAHTKDEWIDLEQLHLAVEVYYQLACALG